MVYVHKSLWVSSTEGHFLQLTRFIGITGGVQDFGVELRGYNGEVLWKPTATGEVALLSTILQGGGFRIWA